MSVTISERTREFALMVQGGRDKIAAALPSHISVERFERVALTAVQNNPALLHLSRQSLFMACLRAAQDGLLPDGRQGAIVGFKDQAQWMPMVGGLMVLARNSGQIASLIAQVVHERDRFVWRPADTSEPIVHEVPALADDRGKPIGAYAIARLVSGEVVAEVMTRAEIEKVRAVSRSKDGPAWSQWWGEMARKSALRRLIKRLPLSTDRPGLAPAVRVEQADATERLVSAVERVDDNMLLEVVAEHASEPTPRASRLDALEAAAVAVSSDDAPDASKPAPEQPRQTKQTPEDWARGVIAEFNSATSRREVLAIVDATLKERGKLLRDNPELHAAVEAARKAAVERTEEA